MNLSRVSDSLGGKAALWELFSSNRPSLELYVTLCAACPYLAGILTSNPGMIDELMDSLLVEHLPTLAMLEESLAELCKGAEDIEPILHSFKNAQHLRVGVRDMLGKDDIRSTHAALADIAEACLKQIAATRVREAGREIRRADDRPAERRGARRPTSPCSIGSASPTARATRASRSCSRSASSAAASRTTTAISTSIFLYEAGRPTRLGRSRGSQRQHDQQPLLQRVRPAADPRANQLGPHGRLYEVDARLRPTGKSGALAVSFDAFARYFAEGPAQLWERQALCKARPVIGNDGGQPSTRWRSSPRPRSARRGGREFATEIREMRLRLEETASQRNLKRGPGGTVDTEFLVQMLQLKHGGDDAVDPRARHARRARPRWKQGGYLSADDAEYFRSSYRFQRSIEARIRLMDAAGRHELPDNERELAKLAYLLGYSDPQALVAEAEHTFAENRVAVQSHLRRGGTHVGAASRAARGFVRRVARLDRGPQRLAPSGTRPKMIRFRHT